MIGHALDPFEEEISLSSFKSNSGADFSHDKSRRYRLWRIWDLEKPKALCIGLNPSKANGEKNDATIRILIKMLMKLGYGGFYMMNCWTYITSKPEMLQIDESSNSFNDAFIKITASECQDVIFAWGDFKVIKEKGRDKELISMFPNAKCFGKSKSGSPLHPLAMSERNGRNPNNPELFLFN